MKLKDFLSSYKHYKKYDEIKEICKKSISGNDITVKEFISLSNKISPYEDIVKITYKGKTIYESENTFNMNLTGNIKKSWYRFQSDMIENHIKTDHFFDHFFDIDRIIESDDFDESEFTFQIK